MLWEVNWDILYFYLKGAQQTADDITAAAPELEPQMQSFPYAVENLAYAVRDQEAFLQASEQMMTGMVG